MRWFLVAIALVFVCTATGLAAVSFMEVGNAAKTDAFAEYYALWEAANKQIKVEYYPLGYSESFDKIKTLYAAGTPYQVSPMYSPRYDSTFMQGGALLTFDEFMQKERIKEQDFLPGIANMWDQFYEGRRIALPYAYTGELLWYNPDLFDTAGLKYPPTAWDDPNWTWKDFVNAGKKMTRDVNGDGVTDVWGLGSIPPATIACFWWGQELFNKNFTEFVLGSPAGAEAVQRAADLALVERIAPIPGTTDSELLSTGRAGMEWKGAWGMSSARSWNVKWNWAVSPMGTRRATVMNVDALYVAKSKNDQDALKWVEFLTTNPDAQLLYAGKGNGKIPALTKAAYKWVNGEFAKLYPGLNFDVLLNGLPYDISGRTGAAVPNWTKISPLLDNAFNRIYAGKASAYQALNEVAPAINAALKENRR